MSAGGGGSQRSADELWAEYLEAERDRIRDSTMPALDRFIERLLRDPPATWQAWAKRLARGIADDGLDTPVRFPLFRRVILPALADGVLRGEPGCARWLAAFESLLVHSPHPALPPEQQTAVGLLAEAVRLEPSDHRARARLVEHRADYLEYTLHELPTGVLYGRDGASVAQCDELLALVDELKIHVAAIRQEERFADPIRECELHYRLYAAYLRSGPLPGGYREYLDSTAR